MNDVHHTIKKIEVLFNECELRRTIYYDALSAS